METFHTTDIVLSLRTEVVRGQELSLFCESDLFHECKLLPWVQSFSTSSVKFASSVIPAQGLAVQLFIRQWEKNVSCIASFAYSIIIIIIIIITLVLWNWLYLNPWVLLFPILLHTPLGARGGVSEQLCDPSCQWPAAWSQLLAARLNHNTIPQKLAYASLVQFATHQSHHKVYEPGWPDRAESHCRARFYEAQGLKAPMK